MRFLPVAILPLALLSAICLAENQDDKVRRRPCPAQGLSGYIHILSILGQKF